MKTVLAIGVVLGTVAPLACGTSSSPPSPPGDAGSGGTGEAGATALGWSLPLQGLQPSLLSVWGTSQSDVFAAGGGLGNGTPATLLHYDGTAWKDLGAGGTDTFWWVHGTSDHDVWAVGTSGRIVHWNGTAFTSLPSGTTATLYGVWASTATDVWVVGGTPGGGTAQPNDVLLHYDGTSFTPSPLPMTFGRTFFKVWGTSSANLYVVGEYGTIWHRTGTTWALEADQPKPLASGNLTTVSGCSATDVYAVGGLDVLQSDGTTWSRGAATVENGVNGVACGAPGHVVLVGFGGYRQRLVAGAWIDDTASSPLEHDLHGAWADPQGGFWAAGGGFVDMPKAGASRNGVLAYYGTAIVASTLIK
jgi:hypothetical protein